MSRSIRTAASGQTIKLDARGAVLIMTVDGEEVARLCAADARFFAHDLVAEVAELVEAAAVGGAR